MSGNRVGGLKTVETIKAKYGHDHYRKLGSKGGKAPHKVPRGFAAMTHEQVSAIGKRGGSHSWKKPRER